MPWDHCGQSNNDDVRCTVCGISNGAWTLKVDKTRLFRLSGAFEGDIDAQVRALEEAAATGTPFCEKCQQTWIDIRLTNADGSPAKDEPYKLVLGDGSEREGKLDENGRAVLQDYPVGEVKIVFPQRDSSSVEPMTTVDASSDGPAADPEGAAAGSEPSGSPEDG